MVLLAKRVPSIISDPWPETADLEKFQALGTLSHGLVRGRLLQMVSKRQCGSNAVWIEHLVTHSGFAYSQEHMLPTWRNWARIINRY